MGRALSLCSRDWAGRFHGANVERGGRVPVLVKVASSTGTVLFESDASEVQLQEMAVGDKIRDVVTETGAAVSTVGDVIRGVTSDLLEVFDDLATGKSEGGSLSTAEVELGVKVTAEGNVVVVKGTVEANVKVTLAWDFS
jgi:hypothetical protein